MRCLKFFSLLCCTVISLCACGGMQGTFDVSSLRAMECVRNGPLGCVTYHADELELTDYMSSRWSLTKSESSKRSNAYYYVVVMDPAQPPAIIKLIFHDQQLTDQYNVSTDPPTRIPFE